MAKTKEELAARRRELAEKAKKEAIERQKAFNERLRREIRPEYYAAVDAGKARLEKEKEKTPSDKKKEEIRARLSSKMKPVSLNEKINLESMARKSKERHERRHNKAPRTTLAERMSFVKDMSKDVGRGPRNHSTL